MAVNITPGLNSDMDEVKRLAETIRKSVLPGLQRASGQKEILVTCRLNETSTPFPSPVWAAWIESEDLQRKTGRKGSSPSSLIGSTHLSPIYTKCLTWPVKDVIHELNYSKEYVRAREKSRGSFQHDVNLGLTQRKFICIVIGNRRVGTLTVGFRNDVADKNKAEIEGELKSWAQPKSQAKSRGKSALVDILARSFNLGGPQN